MSGPVSKLHATRSRRTLLILFCLGYVVLAGGYLLLVAHESGVWQTKRQKLIEESPVVWVAPYGNRYHQESHYGHHLSSPLSLYEATERGYEHCNICNPPPPAQLLQSHIWVRHWLVTFLALSCAWLVVTLVVVHKSGSAIQQTLEADRNQP
jgi:hypothetical protein